MATVGATVRLISILGSHSGGYISYTDPIYPPILIIRTPKLIHYAGNILLLLHICMDISLMDGVGPYN